MRVGVAMTDLSTGLYAYGSVMAALLERQVSGLGQKVDCSLISSQVSGSGQCFSTCLVPPLRYICTYVRMCEYIRAVYMCV